MGKGFGIASLILGIIGIFFAQIILGPLAIIFGIIGRKKDDSKGSATAWLIIGIIGTILAILFIILFGNAALIFDYIVTGEIRENPPPRSRDITGDSPPILWFFET